MARDRGRHNVNIRNIENDYVGRSLTDDAILGNDTLSSTTHDRHTREVDEGAGLQDEATDNVPKATRIRNAKEVIDGTRRYVTVMRMFEAYLANTKPR
jgi:hypothetical protein